MSNATTPAFSIVHGYSQNHISGDKWQEANGRPATLIVKVELPGVNSAAEVSLDVKTDTLELTTTGGCDGGGSGGGDGSKYSLTAELPYAVVTADGAASAKFEVAAHRMVITLPVRPGAPKRKSSDVTPSVRDTWPQ